MYKRTLDAYLHDIYVNLIQNITLGTCICSLIGSDNTGISRQLAKLHCSHFYTLFNLCKSIYIVY